MKPPISVAEPDQNGELPGYTLRRSLRTIVGAFMHFIVFSFALYFLPAIVAAARRTHNATGILLLNVFLGWTVIGWFVALILAMCSAPYYVYYYRRGW